MSHRTTLIMLTCLFVLFSACNRKQNEAVHARLQLWDTQLENYPTKISDSLAQLNPKQLSHANRAYYGLLKTIADDKTFADFTSDSLINSVADYYSEQPAEKEKYIRALIYQGVVRIRMGVVDSTAHTPLKTAIEELEKQKKPDMTALYFANYFLGDLNEEQNNFTEAQSYFRDAKRYACLRNDSTHMFDAYVVLCWNAMKQSNFHRAAHYIDTLKTLTRTPQERYSLLNAQSTYLSEQGEYEQSLQMEKEQLALYPILKEQPEYFRVYYSLSGRYYGLNLLDSALFYAVKAVESITDTTYKRNHLLYENVANIAAAQHNFVLAHQYRSKALQVHTQSVEKQLDTQIIELEKKYDLATSQSKALRAENHTRISAAIAFILLLTLAFLALYVHKQRAIIALKEKETNEKTLRLLAEEKQAQETTLRLLAEKKQAETQALILQQATLEKEKTIALFGKFLTQYSALHEDARQMENKVRAKAPQLGDAYKDMLDNGQQRLKDLAASIFTAEEMGKHFGIDACEMEIFSNDDLLHLFMLAANAPTQQIAALLSSTPDKLKSRKNYLKNKIKEKITPKNNLATLLPFFDRRKKA